MRRLHAFVVVWIVLAASSLPAAEPVNLLGNGGFEDGLSGWTPDPHHVLVRGAEKAHSGNACLSGAVSEANQALILRRNVAVKAGNRYEFEIAARATGGTKLVLFVVMPNGKKRQSLATWEKVSPQWQVYRTPISITADGTLGLQIVAPSSHGAPAGQIWVDDVALYETAMPGLTPVSADAGFNDEPAVARTADGSIYAAWNSFRDGADSLQVARYQSQGKDLNRVGQWQVLGGKGTYLMGIRAVTAGNDALIVYASEQKGNWDIFATRCTATGAGQTVAIGQREGADINPAAAWHQGTLWVAWESNRNGCRQIFAASLRDGQVSGPVAVSQPGISSYDPSIAVLQSGEVCVAWHSFRDNNFDIYLRRRSAGGSWAAETRLTRAPTIDRHPVLVARGDELWIVYENALVKEYHVGATNTRRLIVARVDPQGLMAPKGYRGSPLSGRCENPSPVFDAAGRLWLTYLQPRLPRAGWDVFLTCFSGDRWLQATPLSMQKGMDRQPGLIVEGNRAIVAMQADDIPNSWADVDQTANAKSNIFLATMDLTPSPPAPLQLEPLVEPDDSFEAAEIRVAHGEDSQPQSISYQGQKLRLFYGDLHHHTDVSVCNRVGDQSIEEGYQSMRDVCRLDFACATDHGYNINPYFWSLTSKMVRANEDPGRFLTFLAEEWTSSFNEYSQQHPYGFYGHRNLILADPYFPRWWNARNRQTPAQVWEELRKLNTDFVHIPHQLADTGNVPTDWNYVDETAQPVAEIFQNRGSYEYKGTVREAKRSTPTLGYFLQDAWARGIVIGVIAAPDHSGGYGKACVFAPELTRPAILAALRARRCYGTTAAKIFLDVRVNGHLMGEKVAEPAGKSVEVKITARCPADIDRIEVCRNNRFIYAHTPPGRQAEVSFTDNEPLQGRSYYYVRLVQKDEEIAWTSPVWFGAK